MRTISFQGHSLSQAQRLRLQQQQQVRASLASTRSLVQEVNEFFRSEDWEVRRYRLLEQEFLRYGQCELRAKGTPFVGDAFGF